MSTNANEKNDVVVRLQKEAEQFLMNSELMLNGIQIVPKEIEVYYNKEGEFEDNSVHGNELQMNHDGHFYIHRKGKKETDQYKGGNYPGIDFVMSASSDVYYSYLIRSAVVGENMIIGPHKVLVAIKEATKMKEEEIEKTPIKIVSHCSQSLVLFSERINLGKLVEDQYRGYELRVVICDGYYRNSRYPGKEKMIVEYLKNVQHGIDEKQALEFARTNLGYIPSKVRELFK